MQHRVQAVKPTANKAAAIPGRGERPAEEMQSLTVGRTNNGRAGEERGNSDPQCTRTRRALDLARLRPAGRTATSLCRTCSSPPVCTVRAGGVGYMCGGTGVWSLESGVWSLAQARGVRIGTYVSTAEDDSRLYVSGTLCLPFWRALKHRARAIAAICAYLQALLFFFFFLRFLLPKRLQTNITPTPRLYILLARTPHMYQMETDLWMQP